MQIIWSLFRAFLLVSIIAACSRGNSNERVGVIEQYDEAASSQYVLSGKLINDTVLQEIRLSIAINGYEVLNKRLSDRDDHGQISAKFQHSVLDAACREIVDFEKPTSCYLYIDNRRVAKMQFPVN